MQCHHDSAGKQLVLDVTVVDALAPSRPNQSPLTIPGTGTGRLTDNFLDGWTIRRHAHQSCRPVVKKVSLSKIGNAFVVCQPIVQSILPRCWLSTTRPNMCIKRFVDQLFE